MNAKTPLRIKIEEKMAILGISSFRELADRTGNKEDSIYALASKQSSQQLFRVKTHGFWANKLCFFLQFTPQDLLDLNQGFSFETAMDYLKKGEFTKDDFNHKTAYPSDRFLTKEDVECLSCLVKSPKKISLKVAFELLKATI